jgi:hypothetical protein
MPDQSIIPRDIEGFNIYLTLTNNFIITGSPQKYVQYNWTAQNLSDWQAFKTEWDPLFFKYSDRKGGYTTDIKNDLENIILAAIAYDKVNKLILKVKATVGLTSEDCSTFRIPQSYASPLSNSHEVAQGGDKHKTTMTGEAVYPRMKPMGGGFVEICCHPKAEGSGRAHKPDGFDLVEYKVAVFYWGTKNLPAHATDNRLSTAYSSKAGFTLDTTNFTTNLTAVAEGDIEPTKLAVFFFRWAKSKHPELDGPWSGPFNTPLL